MPHGKDLFSESLVAMTEVRQVVFMGYLISD